MSCWYCSFLEPRPERAVVARTKVRCISPRCLVSSDIKRMFHQIRLLPEDWPLLHLLRHNLQRRFPNQCIQVACSPFWDYLCTIMLSRDMRLITVSGKMMFRSPMRNTSLWTTGDRASLLQPQPETSLTS